MSTDESQYVQEAGAEVIVQIHALCKAVSFYDPNNSAVVRIKEGLLACLQSYFQQSSDHLVVQLTKDEFFINGGLLKLDVTLYERAADLVSRLEPLQVNRLEWTPEIQASSIDQFALQVTEGIRGERVSLEDLPGLLLSRSEGRSIAAFRFQPERLASMVYVSLLELTARLIQAHKGGRLPSLVPLRRALQLYLDTLSSQPHIPLLLSSLPSSEGAPSQSQLRVQVVTESVLTAAALGRPLQEQMVLALASVLTAFGQGDGDAKLAPVYGYKGLGQFSVSVILTLHGVDSLLSRGRSSGTLEQILLLAERFVELRRQGGAVHAVRSLREEPLAGVRPEVMERFLSRHGELPVGSMLRLQTGEELCVMGSQADGDLLAMMMTGGSQGSSFILSPTSWSWIESSLCYGDISWSLGAFGSLSEDSLKPRLSPAAAKLMSPCPQPRGLGTGWTKSSPAPRVSQAPGLEDEEALSARLQGEPTPGPSQELGQAPALEALPSLEEEASPSEEPSSPELAPAAEESEGAQVSDPPSAEAERLYIPAPKKSPEAQRLFQRLFGNPS